MLSSLAVLYERRWLVWYFVQRQLAHSYRSSFLGFLWLFLTPLLMITLYTVVFSGVLKLKFSPEGGSLNFGLYLYCGLIPFTMFSDTLNQSVATIKSNASLVQKVVFPLEILPFSAAATAFLGKLFGLAALVAVLIVVEGQLHWTMLLLPLFMVPQVMFVMGLGYLASVVGTYVPDVRETLRAFTRALFFVTPIIWPPEIVPEDLRFIVDYNPLAYFVGTYRALILDGEFPDMTQTFWFTLLAAVLLVAGFALFVRVKKHFADLI